MHLTLKLINGEEIEQSVDSDIVVFGRSSRCTVHIPHEGMSRQHCQIELINGEVFVTDLNSTNGVFIDNNRIEPNKRIPYNTFFQLSFGAVSSLQIDLEEKKSFSHIKKPATTAAAAAAASTKDDPKHSVITKPKIVVPKNLEKSMSSKQLIINIMVVIAVLAFGYWYMNQGEQVSEFNYESSDEIPSSNPNK